MLSQRSRVVQGEPAAGDDVRDLLSPGQQVLVIFYGVEALDKGKLDLGELLLQPGRQLLEHGAVPQIHGDLDFTLCFFAAGALLLSSAACQHRRRHNNSKQQRDQSFLFHLCSPSHDFSVKKILYQFRAFSLFSQEFCQAPQQASGIGGLYKEIIHPDYSRPFPILRNCVCRKGDNGNVCPDSVR